MGKQIIQIVLVVILQITSINLVAEYFVHDSIREMIQVEVSNDKAVNYYQLKQYKMKKGFVRSHNSIFE